MNLRQRCILRVFSSICVGSLAFCITFLIVILSGALLLSLLGLTEGDGFFSRESAVLFLAAAAVGLLLAVLAGIKYYHRIVYETPE